MSPSIAANDSGILRSSRTPPNPAAEGTDDDPADLGVVRELQILDRRDGGVEQAREERRVGEWLRVDAG